MTPAQDAVAVVIPTRDRAALLERAVRSVLAQTFAPTEVVVVDDGSDPPVKLASDLAADARVRLERNDRPRGAPAARNLGIERSVSPLIAFLDDDDEWYPTKLQRQVAALGALTADEAGDVAGVYCGYALCQPGRPVTRTLPATDSELSRLLLERPCVLPSSLVLRRSALAVIGGFRPDLNRTEDWDLSLRVTDRFRLATVPEVLVRWNRSNTSPAVMLGAYRALMRETLEPRIAALEDAAERRRLTSWHRFNQAVYLAQMGDQRQARAELWRAWRVYPRCQRPILHMARTFMGEWAWESLRKAARRR